MLITNVLNHDLNNYMQLSYKKIVFACSVSLLLGILGCLWSVIVEFHVHKFLWYVHSYHQAASQMVRLTDHKTNMFFSFITNRDYSTDYECNCKVIKCKIYIVIL